MSLGWKLMVLAFLINIPCQALFLRRLRTHHHRTWTDVEKPKMLSLSPQLALLRFVCSSRPLKLRDAGVSIYWWGLVGSFVLVALAIVLGLLDVYEIYPLTGP